MSRKNVLFTLAAVVAVNGTFAVSYPTGYSKGDFTLGSTHRMVLNQTTYACPKDFTCSFGTSSVTVTWKGTAALPAGSGIFGFDLAGPDNFLETGAKALLSQRFRQSAIVEVNFGSPLTQSSNALIVAATGALEMPATTNGTITHSFLSNGGASPMDGTNQTGVMDVPRNIVADLAHATSVHAGTITFTGTDTQDQPQSEIWTVAEAGTTASFVGNKAFKRLMTTTIISGTLTTYTGTTLNAGFGSKLGFDFPVLNTAMIESELHNAVQQSVYNANIVLPFQFTTTEVGAAASRRIPSPVNGVVISAQAAIEVAAATDAGTISVAVFNSGDSTTGNKVAGLELAIAALRTVGAVITATATEGDATQQVSVGQQIIITPSAALSTAQGITGNVTVRPTYTMRGTLVVADINTVPSGSSGDRFGTYTPALTLDGSTSFQVWVRSPDTKSPGTPGYLATPPV